MTMTMINNDIQFPHHHVYAQMSNNNGSSADIDSHISKKYEIRRRLGKVIILMLEDEDDDNSGDTKARRL